MIDEKRLIEDIKDDVKNILTQMFYGVSSEFIDYFLKEMECLINNQPKVGEWIPFEVTEADEEEWEAYGFTQMLRGKLPEEDEEILVTYSNGHVGEDVFLRDGYECYLDSGAEFVVDAVAWMPLPEPYKE